MAELRKRGLITAVVCSDPFLKLGEAQAKTFGVPGLPLLQIPHPLGGVNLEQLTIDALCDERFNLYGIQATTHQCAPLMIVNGPIAKELGINGGHNAFGPGVQANATIGRAIRLALVNIGGAIPGLGDMSTFGAPQKYTYCAAENEEVSPTW